MAEPINTIETEIDHEALCLFSRACVGHQRRLKYGIHPIKKFKSLSEVEALAVS
jgi:hypothetical protein